jgi:hypothetical protein
MELPEPYQKYTEIISFFRSIGADCLESPKEKLMYYLDSKGCLDLDDCYVYEKPKHNTRATGPTGPTGCIGPTNFGKPQYITVFSNTTSSCEQTLSLRSFDKIKNNLQLYEKVVFRVNRNSCIIDIINFTCIKCDENERTNGNVASFLAKPEKILFWTISAFLLEDVCINNIENYLHKFGSNNRPLKLIEEVPSNMVIFDCNKKSKIIIPLYKFQTHCGLYKLWESSSDFNTINKGLEIILNIEFGNETAEYISNMLKTGIFQLPIDFEIAKEFIKVVDYLDIRL